MLMCEESKPVKPIFLRLRICDVIRKHSAQAGMPQQKSIKRPDDLTITHKIEL